MQVETTQKRYVQNIFYNLKVFVPLPKFVANSFVQMQEINLIFFYTTLYT